eukprot:CAMPEP_0114338798 /NCGR_PEP_ID=MMETSP0101-20121206/7281_1 /TAXON_ID=38822 ORGANISM="Pteridomonas danica, Strain PT" /NCGR_SAMPLE_ID=MMETSP0101 /ASSEMBLY_ACC=CAM_ASM_000211 /LENGTH=635 /DNA_ID=CAMNT_0001471509 /DNA_START=4262 /DNA_END=6169 /DNA_ORIENTATION=+
MMDQNRDAADDGQKDKRRPTRNHSSSSFFSNTSTLPANKKKNKKDTENGDDVGNGDAYYINAYDSDDKVMNEIPYIAPELISNFDLNQEHSQEHSKEQDIYSFGMCLLAMALDINIPSYLCHRYSEDSLTLLDEDNKSNNNHSMQNRSTLSSLQYRRRTNEKEDNLNHSNHSQQYTNHFSRQSSRRRSSNKSNNEEGRYYLERESSFDDNNNNHESTINESVYRYSERCSDDIEMNVQNNNEKEDHNNNNNNNNKDVKQKQGSQNNNLKSKPMYSFSISSDANNVYDYDDDDDEEDDDESLFGGGLFRDATTALTRDSEVIDIKTALKAIWDGRWHPTEFEAGLPTAPKTICELIRSCCQLNDNQMTNQNNNNNNNGNGNIRPNSEYILKRLVLECSAEVESTSFKRGRRASTTPSTTSSSGSSRYSHIINGMNSHGKLFSNNRNNTSKDFGNGNRQSSIDESVGQDTRARNSSSTYSNSLHLLSRFSKLNMVNGTTPRPSSSISTPSMSTTPSMSLKTSLSSPQIPTVAHEDIRTSHSNIGNSDIMINNDNIRSSSVVGEQPSAALHVMNHHDERSSRLGDGASSVGVVHDIMVVPEEDDGEDNDEIVTLRPIYPHPHSVRFEVESSSQNNSDI